MTVNMWLQTQVEGVGRKTAQALHGQFASVDELVAAGPERIADALLASRTFTMHGAAYRKAAVYHRAIQKAAGRPPSAYRRCRMCSTEFVRKSKRHFKCPLCGSHFTDDIS